MKRFATALLLGLVTLHANAQPVYRCGNAYSQEPCPQGRIVAATDPRTAAQQADARRVAADERRLAADMRRDRLAEQAAQTPAAAVSLSGAPTPAAKPLAVIERPQLKKRHAAVKSGTPTIYIVADPGTRKQRSRG